MSESSRKKKVEMEKWLRMNDKTYVARDECENEHEIKQILDDNETKIEELLNYYLFL